VRILAVALIKLTFDSAYFLKVTCSKLLYWFFKFLSPTPPLSVHSKSKTGIEMFYELTVCLLGLHTWQNMYGCELRKDGSRGGFVQYGYNGKTFITFNKETLTWVAPDSLAQITQRKWDAIPGKKEKEKAYLEKICIEWLERYLSYGNETLLRREPPVVMVSNRTEVEDGMEMHICWIHGFYPREIDASWRRDGEVWLEDTLHGSVVSNADGTYHYWLSIQTDPKQRVRYWCHVEHNGLQDLHLPLPLPQHPVMSTVDRNTVLLAATILLQQCEAIYGSVNSTTGRKGAAKKCLGTKMVHQRAEDGLYSRADGELRSEDIRAFQNS
uniref:Ig-like domain-containing protein n=1 Tax=Laticauda laticaudata TaxID=8630 RepID=A0A8C5SKG1_LATLA